MIEISHPTSKIVGRLNISGSKSESNRWLILQAIANNQLTILNISNAKDTQVLQKALASNKREINIGHAGTAMRFLTAYFATQPHIEVLLTGSARMQQRPIGPLVEALNALGADISYAQQEGYPPLVIKGRAITQEAVEIRADISSQYITALMLIASSLPKGLNIHFKGNLTSRPYVEMTKAQLEFLGIEVSWTAHGIQIYPNPQILKQEVFVESDWSSASYWYSMVALCKNASLDLGIYKEKSLQGDAILKDIYKQYFGVLTTFEGNQIKLSKIDNFVLPDAITLDLNHSPDIAQTILVSCAGLGIKATLTGLHTLKVKETDRLVAMQKELKKVGAITQIDQDSIRLIAFKEIEETPIIATYQDHRMAMSFAPLALKFPIQILKEEVVEKSYPTFWQDLERVGFKIMQVP